MTRRWTQRTRREALIERLCRGDADLQQIAESMGLGLVRLAGLVDEQGVIDPIASLAHLADLRNQHFLHRYRLHAMATLVELSSQRDDAELARKASVDLLKVAAQAPGRPRPAPDGPAAEPGFDPQAVLRLFDAAGAPTGDGTPDDAAGSEADAGPRDAMEDEG